MTSKSTSIKEYLAGVSADKAPYFNALRDTILKHIPTGFEETMSYGMIGYVVPHNLFPAGYHCNPSLPLPFVNIAAQKNFIALYHMGIYINSELLTWFEKEYPKHSQTKLDMGKSCIRFKKADQIPYALIGKLMQKITVKDWIDLYQKKLHPPK